MATRGDFKIYFQLLSKSNGRSEKYKDLKFFNLMPLPLIFPTPNLSLHEFQNIY